MILSTLIVDHQNWHSIEGLCIANYEIMKTKLLILLAALILLAFAGFSQVDDSVRTRNDKPGTPQSLRTPDLSPRSRVTILNTKAAPAQNVNTGTSEGTNTNTTTGRTSIIVPVPTNNAVPKTPITLQSKPLRLDSIPKAPPNNLPSGRTSNPIRNN
jgi:hypothetical protein